MRIAKFSKHLTISIADEMYNSLKKRADEKEVSIAELARELIEYGFECYNHNLQKG